MRRFLPMLVLPFCFVMGAICQGSETPPARAFLLRETDAKKVGIFPLAGNPLAEADAPLASLDSPFLFGESASQIGLLSVEQSRSILTLVDKSSGTVTASWPFSEHAVSYPGGEMGALHLNRKEACFFTLFPRFPTLVCLSLEDGKTRRITMPREGGEPRMTGDETGRLVVFYVGQEGGWLYEPEREEFLPVPGAFAKEGERLSFGVSLPSEEKSELPVADACFIPGHGLYLLTQDGNLRLLLNADFQPPGEKASLSLPLAAGKALRILPPINGGATVGILFQEGGTSQKVAFFNLMTGEQSGSLSLPRGTPETAIYSRQDGGVYTYVPARSKLFRITPTGEQELASIQRGDTTPFSNDRLLSVTAPEEPFLEGKP